MDGCDVRFLRHDAYFCQCWYVEPNCCIYAAKSLLGKGNTRCLLRFPGKYQETGGFNPVFQVVRNGFGPSTVPNQRPPGQWCQWESKEKHQFLEPWIKQNSWLILRDGGVPFLVGIQTTFQRPPPYWLGTTHCSPTIQKEAGDRRANTSFPFEEAPHSLS